MEYFYSTTLPSWRCRIPLCICAQIHISCPGTLRAQVFTYVSSWLYGSHLVFTNVVISRRDHRLHVLQLCHPECRSWVIQCIELTGNAVYIHPVYGSSTRIMFTLYLPSPRYFYTQVLYTLMPFILVILLLDGVLTRRYNHWVRHDSGESYPGTPPMLQDCLSPGPSLRELPKRPHYASSELSNCKWYLLFPYLHWSIL
jgi:hypothetical protein